MFRIVQYSICALLLLCVSCAKQQQSSTTDVRCAFAADSAYSYIAQQVAFGARVPGTEEHAACGDWLVKKLAQYGAQVQSQYGSMINYAGEEQPLRNIVAYMEGNTQAAILLCAHWDSRPWSDEEPLYENRFTPVIGANDGASGVGVILEIVRQLSIRKAEGEYIPSVQIVFFDAEDMGTPTHYTGKERPDTWCLGSQYWAKEYKQSIVNGKLSMCKCQYGILLDMVGDPSATFRLGYGRYFVQQTAYPITDDHYYVNTLAGVPCVDIIDYKPQNGTGFAEWWHTQQDDMRNINLQTLQAVGETVITTICSR